MSLSALLIIFVAIALMLWGIWVFNRLVRLRNQVRTAWADIDVQLQRRHDLVPQLVTAVKGYASHESALLQSVTELRAQAMTLNTPARLGEVESALEQALARLLVLQEAYPDLKASENFLQLQHELVETEDQLQYARRFYNGAVRDNNDARQRFPDLFVARTFGFDDAEFFQTGAESRSAPTVGMS